jgi:hypothetical protein
MNLASGRNDRWTQDANGASAQTGDRSMIRKLILALGATAALAASVSSASAWHSHHHHGWGWGAFGTGVALGLAAPVVASYPYAGGCYIVKRWVDTPYGPRLRRVTVCN